MHISNERYFDERKRHDLALRMIRHEARTCTIRLCTGLTDDRIRCLYQAYARHQPSIRMRRHRGKSPRRIAFFTRNPRVLFESSLLASLFAVFGLLSAARPIADRLVYVEQFCDAYETFVQIAPESEISFEHGWFLLHLLLQNRNLSMLRCRRCSARYLHDRTTVLKQTCPSCRLKEMPRQRPQRILRSVVSSSHRRQSLRAPLAHCADRLTA